MRSSRLIGFLPYGPLSEALPFEVIAWAIREPYLLLVYTQGDEMALSRVGLN